MRHHAGGAQPLGMLTTIDFDDEACAMARVDAAVALVKP
jgi:hypothetical protein